MSRVISNQDEHVSLVGFTALAPMAVGGLIGLLITRGRSEISTFDLAGLVVFLTGLLALVISLFHLGRPWRAPLALLHLSTSWLSREILLYSLFLLLLFVYLIFTSFYPAKSGLILTSVAGAIVGLVSTITTGATYHLRSRPSWNQILTIISFPLSAMSSGVLYGFFIANINSLHFEPAPIAWIVVTALLLLSMLLSLIRSLRRLPDQTEAEHSRQLVLGSLVWLEGIRVLAALLAVAMIITGHGAQFLAWIPALLGDFVDRFLFFRSVVPITMQSRYI